MLQNTLSECKHLHLCLVFSYWVNKNYNKRQDWSKIDSSAK